MMAVPIVTDPAFEHGTPSLLFGGSYLFSGPARHYDLSVDGERFLMIKDDSSGGESEANEIHIVHNWFEELKALR